MARPPFTSMRFVPRAAVLSRCACLRCAALSRLACSQRTALSRSDWPRGRALSRLACSRLASSLRLGLVCGPLRGPALALAPVHPRCSRRLGRLLQQLQHALGHLVGLGQHRLGGLDQDVVLGVRHHLLRHVGVADGGLGVLDVLSHDAQVVDGVVQTVLGSA